MMKKIILPILIIGLLAIGTIYLPKNPKSEKAAVFNIEKGEGSKEIALNLQKEGLIWWGPIFRAYVFLGGVSGRLQAGGYFLSPSMNIPKIAGKFARGEVAKERITIIEGWDLKDIAWYFESRGMSQAEELLEFAEASGLDLEGYLFPDTYEINVGATIEEIVGKMRDNFDRKTAELEMTPEIVVMASLLEKEVKTKEDKELVSGILWKRIRAGVPLQVDATITYLTGKKTIKISKEDTQIDSSYNTYMYYGLPPGPICNPGLESIIAALSPKDSPYWYYLSTPEGKTIFSKTLQDHNVAKAKYLK